MNLEIVEAYPMERENTFSMHVYLPDEDLDIRGILVIFKKRWVFMMPNKSNWDEDEQRNVSFPCLGFCNPAKQKEFTESLIEKGTFYMQEKMSEIMMKKRVIAAKNNKKPKKT